MSVINNVLKDLESRSSQFVPIEIASVEAEVTEKPAPSGNLAAKLMLVLLVVATIFWVYLQQPFDLIGQPEIIVDTPTPVVLAKSEPVEIVEPLNQIIDLQVNESANDMSLEFSLQKKVVSYLKERSENSFVYHLKNIRSEIVAPVIRNNQWIEQLSINARDQGVDITFRTVAAVLVETRQQLQGDEQIWAIKLKKSPAPKLLVESVEAPIRVAIEQPPGKPAKAEIVGSSNKPQIKAVTKAPAESKVVKLDIRSNQPKSNPDEQLQKAVKLVKKRRWNQAETLLQGLIGGPNDLIARRHLLSIFEKRQQSNRYSALLGESLKHYPQQAVFKTAYARSLFKLGAYQDVINYLQNINNADATQLALIAASYQRLDQHQQAVDYYRQSLDKDRRQTKNWIGLGISQEHTAQLKDALRSYRNAARLGNINARLQSFIEKRSDLLIKATR